MRSLWPVLAGALAAAAGAAFAAGEVRWRSLASRELPEEVTLGALRPEDLGALVSWKRFGAGWLTGVRERRAFRRIAARLARAKAAQRRAPAARRKLMQVQILGLRTRLRGALSGLADVERFD